MKKISIVVTVLLAIVASLVAGYYFLFTGSDYGAPRAPKDLTGIIVPPVEFSMKGKSFIVPNSSTTVTLDLVSATAKRDYPMGRFTTSEGMTATLVAQDDFTSPLENNIQTVPIVIAEGENVSTYLALLEGEGLVHTTSLPIGGLIKITNITRENDKVTIDYLVHDRGQNVIAEVPSVSTSAIFDINTKTVLQKGRTPATETYVEAKSFKGEYLWKTTKFSDGKTTVPRKDNVFTLLFDANRISLGTDCNTGSAVYKAETGSTTSFTIEPIASTKMFCEPGQEGEYFSMMQTVVDYVEETDGSLVFTLQDDALMTFTPKTAELEFASTTTAN